MINQQAVKISNTPEDVERRWKVQEKILKLLSDEGMCDYKIRKASKEIEIAIHTSYDALCVTQGIFVYNLRSQPKSAIQNWQKDLCALLDKEPGSIAKDPPPELNLPQFEIVK